MRIKNGCNEDVRIKKMNRKKNMNSEEKEV